ncbi:MAG: ACT domain-containing protein, partial [Syntrophales bacterium LBB04]|nr:ACT domain-containing protein [Syntrophales bacterium LBB04]
MITYQLSIFAENKPGRLAAVTRVLAKEMINIRATTIATSDTFGVINLIVDDPPRAEAALNEAGHIIPSYALHLSTVFAEAGVDPRRDTKLRIAFLGAEPHSEKMRRIIEEFYGFRGFNSYGLSEMNGPGVAFECPEQRGMHIWEDNYIAEVVDPVTLNVLPDGEEGELVMTTLLREGMPIIRYRTKDLTRIVPGACPCGRTHRRIERIKGRTDDMMILKGVNIFPIQIEKRLMEIPGVGTNFLIILDREGYNDQMTVKVEIRREFFGGNLQQLQALRQRIVEELRSDILITPKVDLVEPDSL